MARIDPESLIDRLLDSDVAFERFVGLLERSYRDAAARRLREVRRAIGGSLSESARSRLRTVLLRDVPEALLAKGCDAL